MLALYRPKASQFTGCFNKKKELFKIDQLLLQEKALGWLKILKSITKKKLSFHLHLAYTVITIVTMVVA